MKIFYEMYSPDDLIEHLSSLSLDRQFILPVYDQFLNEVEITHVLKHFNTFINTNDYICNISCNHVHYYFLSDYLRQVLYEQINKYVKISEINASAIIYHNMLNSPFTYMSVKTYRYVLIIHLTQVYHGGEFILTGIDNYHEYMFRPKQGAGLLYPSDFKYQENPSYSDKLLLIINMK